MKPQYREVFATRDVDRLMSLVPTMLSSTRPVLDEPGFEGRESASAILAIALHVFEDAEYTPISTIARTCSSLTRGFSATGQDRNAPELNAEGEINEIWLMARPLTGITAVAEAAASLRHKWSMN